MEVCKITATDGTEVEYTAHIIAQNIYAQCFLDGNQHTTEVY